MELIFLTGEGVDVYGCTLCHVLSCQLLYVHVLRFKDGQWVEFSQPRIVVVIITHKTIIIVLSFTVQS